MHNVHEDVLDTVGPLERLALWVTVLIGSMEFFLLILNVRAEQEIEAVLRHPEYQNTMLIAMVQKLGIDIDAGLHNKRP